MKKINVALYGGKSIFGGKETPLRAEAVYCDKTEVCSLYKQGKCLNVTDVGMSGCCKFGNIAKNRGYTSRAKKYEIFRSQYRSDEAYGRLYYPHGTRVALIDDYVWLNLDYIDVRQNDSGLYYIDENYARGRSWVPKSGFNVDLLKGICDAKPRPLFGGGVIKAYGDEVIPELLYQLKKLMPDLYTEFINKYPECDKAPNHVGKVAYVKTLNRDSVLKVDNNEFVFDGDCLVCKDYRRWNLPLNSETAEIRVKITDDMTYWVTDNAQVTEETEFKL